MVQIVEDGTVQTLPRTPLWIDPVNGATEDIVQFQNVDVPEPSAYAILLGLGTSCRWLAGERPTSQPSRDRRAAFSNGIIGPSRLTSPAVRLNGKRQFPDWMCCTC